MKVVESSERLVEAITNGVGGVSYHSSLTHSSLQAVTGSKGQAIPLRAPDGGSILATLAALQTAGARCGLAVTQARDDWANVRGQCERDTAALDDNWVKFQLLVADFQRRCDGAEHSFGAVTAQLQHEQESAAGVLELALRGVVDVQRRSAREARKMHHYRSVLLDAQACVGDTRDVVNTRRSKLADATGVLAAGVESLSTVAAATRALADAVEGVVARSSQRRQQKQALQQRAAEAEAAAFDRAYVASMSDSWRLVNQQLEQAQMRWDTALLRADILKTNLENSQDAANFAVAGNDGAAGSQGGCGEEQALLERLKKDASDAGAMSMRLKAVARAIENDVRNCLAHTSQCHVDGVPQLCEPGHGQAAVDSLLKELSQHSLAGAVIAADAEDQLRVLQDLSTQAAAAPRAPAYSVQPLQGISQITPAHAQVAPGMGEPQRSVSELMDELMTPALQGAFSEQTLQMIADQVQGL
jgi:hypothetical protein